MELSNSLPEGSQLTAGSFKKWEAGRDERRLSLSINHFVGGTMSGGGVEGSSTINYIIQVPPGGPKLSDYLSPSLKATCIGFQSPDLVRSLTEAYRPKMTYALAEVGDGLFDLRGLAYVLGAAVACGSSGVTYTYENPIAGAKLLAPTWTVPSSGELTIGPGVIQDKREYVTLMKLAKTAGSSVVQLISDTLPPSSAKPLQSGKLASFAMRILSSVLLSSQACGCADHHLLAFFRGQNAVYSLWAHTDEGGWLRSALREADYPPSTGVVASTGDSIIGIPARRSLNSSECTRISVGLFLTMVGMIPVADARATGLPTAFTKDEGSLARPGSYPGLVERVVDVFEAWRDLASTHFGLFKSQVLDAHSLTSFNARDKVDSHLEGPTIIPFWWVEPSPLFSGDSGKLLMPGKLGERTVLPFAPTDLLLVPRMMEDHRGCLPGGGRVRAKLAPGSLRGYAMNYIMSSNYRPSNGLSQLTYVTSPRNGVHTTEAMFTPEGVNLASDRRWFTPHNPIPNPCEGYSDLPMMVEYTYIGLGREPSLKDWSECKLSSSFGLFYISPPASLSNKVSHKFVPSGLLSLVDKYHSDERWTALVGSESAMVPYSETPKPPPNHANLPEPLEEELVVVSEPEDVDVKADDPEQTVPAAPDLGERQNLPSQNREDGQAPPESSEETPPEPPGQGETADV